MSDTNIQTRPFDSTQDDAQSLSAILARVANPLLLFSSSLCLLLFLSWMFLLPKFTGVQRPDGVSMTPRGIAAYTQKLSADLADAQEHRTTLVRAVDDEGYRALVDARTKTFSSLDIERELRLTAARLSEEDGTIVFSSITVKGVQVAVEGDVRNVGTRSLTILAAFIDSLGGLSFISNLQRPAFARETLPDGSMHSPFRFSFDLPAS